MNRHFLDSDDDDVIYDAHEERWDEDQGEDDADYDRHRHDNSGELAMETRSDEEDEEDDALRLVDSPSTEDDDDDEEEELNEASVQVDTNEDNERTTTDHYNVQRSNIDGEYEFDMVFENDEESFVEDDDDGADEVDEALLEDDDDEDDEKDNESSDDEMEVVDCDKDSYNSDQEVDHYFFRIDSDYGFDDKTYRYYRHDARSKVEITKQSLLGGPITSVLVLPILCHNPSAVRYDVLYGHGPYLHHIPHRAWIEHHQQQQSQQQPLLVFPNGGTIHGIRDYYDDEYTYNLILVFGGQQLAFIGVQQEEQQSYMHRIIINDQCDNDSTDHGTVSNGRNINHNQEVTELQAAFAEEEPTEAEKLYQQFRIDVLKTDDDVRLEREIAEQNKLKELSMIPYHTTFDDWIWDCRVVSLPSLGNNKTKKNRLNEDIDYVDVQHESIIVVGFAHQQIETCRVQLVQTQNHVDTLMNKDQRDSNETTIYKINFQRLQAIANESIPKCIAYCMNIWKPSSTTSDDQNVMIGSGTVSNEICIWSLSLMPVMSHTVSASSQSMDQYRSYPTPHNTVLRGHEGVIHAIKFHESGQFILSTSDDRTVRLWEKKKTSTAATTTIPVLSMDDDPTTYNQQWILKWTAYGHTARGWDIIFCDLSTTTNSSDVLEGTVVLSTGEDSTLRIWDATNGNALAVLRGHSCQCIWRVATIESDNKSNGFTITAGNNGTVAFYNIRTAIPSSWWKRQEEKQYKSDIAMKRLSLPPRIEPEGCWQLTFKIPIDYDTQNLVVDDNDSDVVGNTCGTERTTSGPASKKTKKDRQQVVIGMKFIRCRYYCNDGNISKSDDDNEMIIATQWGCLWALNIHFGSWTELTPWNCIPMPHSKKKNNHDLFASAQLSAGSCMCVHPDLPIVAIGTVNGDIVLSQLSPSDSTNNATKNDGTGSHFSMLLPAQLHRSAQSMKWLHPSTLVSFHVQSIILWIFPYVHKRNGLMGIESLNTPSTSCAFNDYTTLALRTGLKGLAICSALNDGHTMLVIGDTRGNLSLFDVTSQKLMDENDSVGVPPVSVVRLCHQKMHVTDVVWKDWKTILSVGNDGKICKCVIDNNKKLMKLLSIPVGSFTGLGKVWNFTANNQPTVVVGGYYGNKFAIVDVSNGYEFFSVDTGGRQRTIDVWLANNELPPSNLFTVAICINRHDGCNEVQLHGRGSEFPIITTPMNDTLISHSRGVPMHGESIFDIHLFHIDEKRRTFGILTGSEDCSAKVTVYRDGTALTTILLPPQVSGIRAVCSCRFDLTSSLLAIGGKNFVDLFLVKDIDDATTDDVVIRYVGQGSPMEKLPIDHRINCVRSVRLRDDNYDGEKVYTTIVVSGDSNGSCYAYRFSGDFNASGKVIYKNQRPILCLDIVSYGSHCLLFIGGTSGDVAVISLCLNEDDIFFLLTMTAHSMGTNSISARSITPTCNIVRVISCGDDQSICCTDVHLSEGGESVVDAHVKSTFTMKEAALSALKGIEFISDNLFVTTGYDQKITVWGFTRGKKLLKVHECPIDIGDVNCFSTCSVGRTHRCTHLLAVGGAGVEVLQLHLKRPPWR